MKRGLEGLFSLKKRRLWGHLRTAFQYLKGAYKRVEKGLLPGQIMTGQRGIALN